MQAAKHKTLFLAAMLILGIQPLAAHTHVAQNSRLGPDTFKTSLHQQIELRSSLKALEIDASVRRTCVRSRSTGKERDAETGLDYFGARYMSAAQGRFTSPDAPFADQHPEDPQSWNLYAYARNNPLVFVDPTGEAIELTGDQKERDELLKRLQEATGDKKGQYLYANKVDGKYYVGIYANGKDGKAGSFSELGKAAGLVGQVVGSDKVAALQLVREGTGSPAGPFKPDNPAATFLDPGNPNRTLSALLSDKAPAVLPAEVMATGLPGRTDHGLVAIHELGHAFAKFHARDRVYSGPYDVQMSLDFENAARRDKGMPLRLQHGKNVVPLPKPPR